MINLNQLRAFYETARFMSFSAAAKNLFVSQPAVTKQVKSFAEHCGINLFVRKGTNLHLTEEGRIIFEYARKVFECEKTLEEVIEAIANLNRGCVHVGTARTYARYFMPHLISTFHKNYPQIEIKLVEGSSEEVLRNLFDLKIQVAIVAWFEDVPDVRHLPLYREEVVLIVSPDHRLARKGEIAISELKDEPLIMREVGSGTRKLVNYILSENNIVPNVMMESSDAEMVKLLVRHGEGVSFLVRAAVSSELRDKILIAVPIKDSPIFLEVCAVYLNNNPLSPAAKAFVRILEKLIDREGVLNSLEEFVRKMSVSAPGSEAGALVCQA